MKSEIKPTVSVIMLVYNLERYVAQAIEGALMQETSFSVEIVIGEDCSTDKSKEICLDFERRFPDKIRVLRRPQNLGLMANFADTLKNCRGKYVAFCDGDDYWTDPLKLTKQVEFLDIHPEYVICHHDFISIDESGTSVRGLYPQKYQLNYTAKEMALGAFMKSNTLLFRNSPVTFPEESLNKDLKLVNNDTFLVALLSRYGGAAFIPDIKPSVYRVHSSSNFSSLGERKKFESELKTFEFVRAGVDKAFLAAVDSKLFKLNYLRYVALKQTRNRYIAGRQALRILFTYPTRTMKLLIKYKSPLESRDDKSFNSKFNS